MLKNRQIEKRVHVRAANALTKAGPDDEFPLRCKAETPPTRQTRAYRWRTESHRV